MFSAQYLHNIHITYKQLTGRHKVLTLPPDPSVPLLICDLVFTIVGRIIRRIIGLRLQWKHAQTNLQSIVDIKHIKWKQNHTFEILWRDLKFLLKGWISASSVGMRRVLITFPSSQLQLSDFPTSSHWKKSSEDEEVKEPKVVWKKCYTPKHSTQSFDFLEEEISCLVVARSEPSWLHQI